MKLFYTILTIFLFGLTPVLRATDTCIINDVCLTAIDLGAVVSDVDAIYHAGCNMYAAPDPEVFGCYMADFPTVWYRLETDAIARVMDLEIYSPDFESPAIALFSAADDCDNLTQIQLEQTADCVLGADHLAKVIGISVDTHAVYYIAVSSLASIGGNFVLTAKVHSTGFKCVLDRNIEIVARSNGGPLEGPFVPNETVTICMHVNHYTAANNGCQWFQGIVPVFGNGWDPASFDSKRQPLGATVNGAPIGSSGNGIYGTSQWDWQDSVGYHYDHPTYNIGDFDGNGTLDICNSLHESDCVTTGITGGCCGPCWIEHGTKLPPGWFATGINGTCPDTQYVAQEWGDGNTCGGGMGPWHFCFDLVTRDVDDCMIDSTYSDLTLGFYTFADGEIGAWTGNASVCALDVPAKISMVGLCGRMVIEDDEELPVHTHGDTLRYIVSSEGITNWEWNLSPFNAIPYIINTGKNGVIIEAPLVNETEEPIDITGTLIGRTAGTGDILIRKIKFILQPTGFVGTNGTNTEPDKLKLYPSPANNQVSLQWHFDLHQDATIDLHNAQGEKVNSHAVNRSDGNIKRIDIDALPPGMYYLHFYNGDMQYTRKLVKL